jgi:integrase
MLLVGPSGENMTKAKTKIGRIYKKWNKRPDGSKVEHSTWTVRFKGKDYATGETDVKKAQQFLLKLVGESASGTGLVPLDDPSKPLADVAASTSGKILMNEIFDGFDMDQKRKKNASGRQNIQQVALHMRPFFGKVPADELTSALFEKYIDKRTDEEAAPATVNRELAHLKRALNLALRREPPQVTQFPHIEMLKVSNARQGFLRHDQYVALKHALPEYLVPIFIAAYHVGTRRGELLQVEFQDIEMNALGKEGKVRPQFRLYPDATKNGKGRIIPIYGEMVEVFKQQIAMTRESYPKCTHLFHCQGEPILSFYKAWATATDAVGLSGLLFHDLRRTGVRDLIRAGNDRKSAMAISGHLTEHTFERYNITDEEDLHVAADKMTNYLEKLEAQLVSTSPLVS